MHFPIILSSQDNSPASKIEYVMNMEELLPDSLIAKHLPCDYADSYAKVVSCREPLTADVFFDMAFNRPSYWGKKLLRMRDRLVKPLKLKAVGCMSDMICEQDAREIIFGKADRHLTFHTSLLCGKHSGGRQELRITTVVKFHHVLGRVYFFFVRPFHVVIVRSLLRRVVKNLPPSL